MRRAAAKPPHGMQGDTDQRTACPAALKHGAKNDEGEHGAQHDVHDIAQHAVVQNHPKVLGRRLNEIATKIPEKPCQSHTGNQCQRRAPYPPGHDQDDHAAGHRCPGL